MSTTALPEHPADMCRGLLLDQWGDDPTAAAGYDPRIPYREPDGLALSRGWYDSTDTELSVGLTNFSEPATTDSGYTGIDPSGSGATQRRQGSGLITVFADAGRTYHDLTAESIATVLRQHIEGVVFAAQNDDELPKPWEFASTSWDDSSVDTEATPHVHSEQLSFRYGWQRTP